MLDIQGEMHIIRVDNEIDSKAHKKGDVYHSREERIADKLE